MYLRHLELLLPPVVEDRVGDHRIEPVDRALAARIEVQRPVAPSGGAASNT